MTIEEALALIPAKATAWDLRTRQRRTRFVCTLSWLIEDNDSNEDEVTGHGHTPQEAIMAAIGKLKDQP
jgi:hypothetical protein